MTKKNAQDRKLEPEPLTDAEEADLDVASGITDLDSEMTRVAWVEDALAGFKDLSDSRPGGKDDSTAARPRRRKY
ncbi:MAG: hypothetical protein H7Z74_04720 [Anaerolineae bacterium]|nr:hypothetical protein [Gemmatimonadaceae bacterium]